MTDLTNFIRVYDDALSPDFCNKTIAWFHANPESCTRNGGSVRAGLEESSWVEADLTGVADFGFNNVIINAVRHYKGIYERDCGIRPALPEPPELAPFILKRYEPVGTDRFQPHFDSVGPVSGRYMVFLWYLNDVADGGETAFVDLDVNVAPKAGRLLIFPPYWMYRHAGKAPISGDKYILSTYPMW